MTIQYGTPMVMSLVARRLSVVLLETTKLMTMTSLRTVRFFTHQSFWGRWVAGAGHLVLLVDCSRHRHPSVDTMDLTSKFLKVRLVTWHINRTIDIHSTSSSVTSLGHLIE
jgi:hypothetical protein